MQKALIILASLILGLILGAAITDALPAATQAADIIGTMWLNGLKMTVVPLVVSLLIVGIVQTAAAAKAGRIAGYGVATMVALLWISSITAAIMIPLLTGLIPLPAEAAEPFRAALGISNDVTKQPGFADILKNLVPGNPINAAANDAILPLIIFTLAFAFAVVRLPESKRGSVLALFEGVAEAMVMVVGWVLALAPIGVFALAYTLGVTAGTTAFAALLHYVVVLVLTGAVIWLLSFLVAWVGARRHPLRFFQAAIPAQAVAISTQSSLASMPAMLKGLDSLGVRVGTSEIVLPVAVALFRATGPAMNLGVALYIAHMLGMQLGWEQIMLGIAVGAITTMGAVSLPGSISFVSSIAPICAAMGVPLEPLALLIAIETFPDIMRTVGNVTMDMAVTATIDERVAPDEHSADAH